MSYGWPALEETKNGDMVLGFTRSGATVFPQACYGYIYANETFPDPPFGVKTLVRPGYCLQNGSYPAGPDSENGVAGRIDVSGAAVDPSDDASIWIIQPYAVKVSLGSGTYRLAVGRVKP